MLNTFDEFIDYLDSFYFTPTVPGLIRDCRLERMEMLLQALGNPEKSFKTIHLAGSKGKGSCAAFLSALLTSYGEKTGLYLSPHLIDYRERFTLNGTFFSDEELLTAANELKTVVDNFTLPENLGGVTRPTPFELYTAYAYILFKNAHCTYAVIETGMGGRLDATNTLSSIIEVITPIELEHTQVLGNTVEEIALEKAKIIKPNSIVFSSFQKIGARKVILKEAEIVGVPITFLDEMVNELITHTTLEGESVHCVLTSGEEFNLLLSMRGEVQAQNAILSLLVAMRGGFYEKGKSERAVEKVQLPGRFELMNYKGHNIIFDVAHTKESVAHTINSFKSIFQNKDNNAVIYASVEGKDTTHMLSSILSSFNDIIISRPGTFKKSNTEEIYNQALAIKRENNHIYHLPDSKEALDKALSCVKDDGALLIIGSFYLAQSLMEAMNA